MKVICGIINKEDSGTKKYLLVASKKDFEKYPGHYYPPGGKVKPGETDEECLRRELKEEVGLELLSCELMTETGADIPDQTIAWYECIVKSYEIKPNLEELLDAGYYTKEQMDNMNLWPATKEFFERHVFS